MSARAQKRAFGVAAGLKPEVCGPLAQTCEEVGYTAILANDHPGAKGLETLAEFAKVTDKIDLGVGVIALDRQSPETIAADIDRLGLDRSRLWIGVGAGFSKKPLTFMREMLPELREHLDGVRVVMAAMGPKMCALAGAEYDGAFFNWMTADFAADAREQVEAGAAEARHSAPPVFGYVRTAIGEDAESRLAKEESFYRDLHKGYRNHFDRLGAPEGTVGVAAPDAESAQAGLAEYSALDVIVVRGLASARAEPMTELARAAAPP
jgi:alkanesulfonate monooxygenase SsuD/methylene tetrahydromethanopterin reductase-like flavin-dependent oxidoreductase (luciferase family)